MYVYVHHWEGQRGGFYSSEMEKKAYLWLLVKFVGWGAHILEERRHLLHNCEDGSRIYPYCTPG